MLPIWISIQSGIGVTALIPEKQINPNLQGQGTPKNPSSSRGSMYPPDLTNILSALFWSYYTKYFFNIFSLFFIVSVFIVFQTFFWRKKYFCCLFFFHILTWIRFIFVSGKTRIEVLCIGHSLSLGLAHILPARLLWARRI